MVWRGHDHRHLIIMPMKKLLPIIIGLCLLPSLSFAAISFDASSSAGFSGATTATGTITVGSGSNEMLIGELIGGNAGFSNPSMTVDGNSATLVIAVTVGTNRSDAMWYYPNLSAGSHTVSTTWTTALQGILSINSFFGVKQSSTVDATSTSNNSSANPSSNLTTSVAGDLVIDGTTKLKSQNTTALGGSQAALVLDAGSGAIWNGDASYYTTSTIGSVNSQYTLAGSGNWQMIQAAFEAASGSSSPSPSSTLALSGGTLQLSGGVMQIQ
jgi:hypothetical protein